MIGSDGSSVVTEVSTTGADGSAEGVVPKSGFTVEAISGSAVVDGSSIKKREKVIDDL